MSCYFRHLKDILEEAGIVVDPSHRRRIDQVIHELAGTTYKDCPVTWRKLKQDILSDKVRRQEFALKLRDALKQG